MEDARLSDGVEAEDVRAVVVSSNGDAAALLPFLTAEGTEDPVEAWQETGALCYLLGKLVRRHIGRLALGERAEPAPTALHE